MKIIEFESKEELQKVMKLLEAKYLLDEQITKKKALKAYMESPSYDWFKSSLTYLSKISPNDDVRQEEMHSDDCLCCGESKDADESDKCQYCA